jgi:hypothetical protein
MPRHTQELRFKVKPSRKTIAEINAYQTRARASTMIFSELMLISRCPRR